MRSALTCLLAALLSGGPALAQGSLEPPRLIAEWTRQNAACRGGPGDSSDTHEACGRREAFGQVLGELGWCYGRRDEIGAAMRWHRCEPSSNRQRLPR